MMRAALKQSLKWPKAITAHRHDGASKLFSASSSTSAVIHDFIGLLGLKRSGTILPASMSDRSFSSDSIGSSTVFRHLSSKHNLTLGRLTFIPSSGKALMRYDGLIIGRFGRL